MSHPELIDLMFIAMASGHCKNQIVRFPYTEKLMLQLPDGILIGDLTKGSDEKDKK